MAFGLYPRRTSDVLTANRQASQVVMVRPYLKEQWVVGLVVAHEDRVSQGRTTFGNGQTSLFRHCCASWTTEVDDQPSQRIHMSEYHNDAGASRILIS